MRRRLWLPLLGSGVVVSVAVGAVSVRAATEASASDDVKAAVEAFFEARQAGDCDRVLAAVSEASWSEQGRLDREGFLERCPEVVEHYQPGLVDVRVVSLDGDDATVQVELPVEDDAERDLAERDRTEGLLVEESDEGERTESAYGDGRVVREDGRWKVEMDAAALGLGPSARDTVLGLLEAYRDGKCEEAADLVSDEAWSGVDRTDRAGFLDDCSVLASAREQLLAELQPTAIADEVLTVLPRVPMPSQRVSLWISAQQDKSFAEPVVDEGAPVELLVEDLRWKIADLDGLEAFEHGADYARLDAQMSDEVLGLPRTEVEARRGTSFTHHPASVARPKAVLVAVFGSSGGLRVGLDLYEFTDAAAAAAFAQHLADRDLQVASRRHEFPPAVPVPAVPGVSALVTRCDTRIWQEACTHAHEAAAVSAHGVFVVHVRVEEPPLLDLLRGEYPTADVVLGHALEPLTTQIEALAG